MAFEFKSGKYDDHHNKYRRLSAWNYGLLCTHPLRRSHYFTLQMVKWNYLAQGRQNRKIRVTVAQETKTKIPCMNVRVALKTKQNRKSEKPELQISIKGCNKHPISHRKSFVLITGWLPGRNRNGNPALIMTEVIDINRVRWLIWRVGFEDELTTWTVHHINLPSHYL